MNVIPHAMRYLWLIKAKFLLIRTYSNLAKLQEIPKRVRNDIIFLSFGIVHKILIINLLQGFIREQNRTAPGVIVKLLLEGTSISTRHVLTPIVRTEIPEI